MLRALALASSLALSGFPPSAAAAARDPIEGSLRIATWNLRWLGAVAGRGEQPRTSADYARLRRYAERLNADVVALQEVEGQAAARLVFDPATYAFHFTRERDNAQLAGFAWRRSLDVEPLPDVTDLDLDGTRRGADLRLRLGDRTLRLLSVHLKAHCTAATPRSGKACRTLFEQLRALESWVDRRARDGEPFAVLGDFNRHFGPRDAFWTDLDDGEPQGADLVDTMQGLRPRCWSGRYRKFVDYLVLGSEAAGWVVPASRAELVYDEADAPFEEVLSDHCPLSVDLDPPRASGEDREP